jgi:hypothetical protein
MTKDHCITMEGEQVYFTINGCKIKAEDLKCVKPDEREALCEAARAAFGRTPGRPPIYLTGSISPPIKRGRP